MKDSYNVIFQATFANDQFVYDSKPFCERQNKVSWNMKACYCYESYLTPNYVMKMFSNDMNLKMYSLFLRWNLHILTTTNLGDKWEITGFNTNMLKQDVLLFLQYQKCTKRQGYISYSSKKLCKLPYRGLCCENKA